MKTESEWQFLSDKEKLMAKRLSTQVTFLPNGKCGKNGNFLVMFLSGEKAVVVGRRLRKTYLEI